MLVDSFLVQGTGSSVAGRLSTLLTAGGPSLGALVLFSLGADHSILKSCVGDVKCPIYLTETYGILGFDPDIGENIELMEKGRGSEYGYAGGSGGQGCLVVGFRGNVVAGHEPKFPESTSSLMVIADQSGSWAQVQDMAPVQYGGITKECWKVTTGGDLESVPYFWVADTSSSEAMGVTTFSDDAAQATKSLLGQIPSDVEPSGAVGLFPCFTRGVNLYNAENVETSVISSIVPNARIYGMFAHGELGPVDYIGFTASPNKIPCKQHSMTSILSIPTVRKALN